VALKIKLAHPPSAKAISLRKKILLISLISAGAVAAVLFIIFGFYYYRYGRIVDQRLKQPLFANTAKIFAAPREVRDGQKLSPLIIAQELREGGYTEEGAGPASSMGTYRVNATSIIIHPGPQSYHSQDGATITFDNGLVNQITGDKGQELVAYELEPVMITGLSEGANRTKRRLVKYDELPQNLVNAVVSIEDRRFFDHGGVDYIRLLGALRNDLTHKHTYIEGGSTLTMQLARGFFLSPEKRLKRKLIEIVITYHLENHFNKKQIFEMYANQIPLGQQGSFAINGFGEAAQAYFDKDVKQLDLAECALLAGMVQQPSFRNPYRHPERAVQRRNVVLDAMMEMGKITKEQAHQAKVEPLHLANIGVDAGEAPYFVDLVRDQIAQKIGDRDYNQKGVRIYTSLDPDLQRAATEAVDNSMKELDARITRLHAHKAGNITYPQVALVALNPHTGQVLALVGGRNYGSSQLNHAVARRPTGSIFKPFVYATAFNTTLTGTNLPGENAVFSPVTMLNDEQTTYTFGNQEYSPRNFHAEYHEEVTARQALMQSLNNATIGLAQMVGYNNVASLARDAGIKSARGTPAVAIGAYDATPLDMAGAYTVFANGGVKIDPWMLASIRNSDGDILSDFSPSSKPVLDPRVSYLTLSLMQNVINNGTGYEVRRRGFMAPAAGKTGTSHDAWFAGFTSNLLCIVWVGNDDYSDIKLTGTVAAAPIWTEFMKRAVQLPQYSDTHDFPPPEGVDIVRIDKATNLISTASCPDSYTAAFLSGTAPTDTCDHANGDQRNLFQKLFGLGEKPATPPANTPTASTPVTPQPPSTVPPQTPPPPAVDQANSTENNPPKKKKGFFGKLFGAIAGNGDKDKQQQQQQKQDESPKQ
jgi:penicillin-binding protein 1B